MGRKRLSPDTEKEVLVLARRRCCICFGLNRDISIKSGQIAHLDRNAQNNDLDNLAFLCFDHHNEYDGRTSQSKGLTSKEVRHFRKELHQVIDKAWKQPVQIGNVEVGGQFSGRYIRDGEFESAELQVSKLVNGVLRVTGIALWGKTREYGPNLGLIDFEAELINKRVEFSDCTHNNQEYRLELTFYDDSIVAEEEYVVGYFGMNVSFEGNYYRV